MKTALSLALTLALPVAYAGTSEEIQQFHARFHQAPAKVMEEMPARTQVAKAIDSVFTDEQIASGEYITLKDQQRRTLLNGGGQGIGVRSIMSRYNDNPADLVDAGNQLIDNLFSLDQAAPRTYSLAVQPWSDTYWPLYSGATSWRYGDPELRRSYPRKWQDYFDFSQQNPVETYSLETRANLSPAEKYDLIVGDSDFSLTKNAWDSGKGYADRNNGEVETWMGLCHGWAPAAYMLPRPSKTITVKDANGEDLVLFPSDVKAMGTMLWANARFDTKFIGGRCNIKNPDKDESGRIKEQQCFDTNPGSWHISVLNQLGISHRSLIIDATYDYQVWNQPLQSYKVSYFNPETGRTYDKLEDAVIAMSEFESDKFSTYRAQQATKVVGVRMDIDYIVETNPSHRRTDSEDYDGVTSVSYYYDLELNDAGDIIGGEWYQNRHPDFLWTPSVGAEAQSYYAVSGTWNEGESIPASWKSNAKKASRYGHPQTALVNELFRRASDQVQGFEPEMIRMGTSNFCLDAYQYDENGVIVYECNEGYEEQFWTLDAQSRLVSKSEGLCLEAPNLQDGAIVQLKTCGEHVKQQWVRKDGRFYTQSEGFMLDYNSNTRLARLTIAD